MEQDGAVPVPLQFWASWRAVVGFCEVGVPPPHFTPATDSCGILVVSFNASQRTAGQYSLHLSQKNLKYFGGGICVHSYVGGEAGSALPVHPRSSHLLQSHLFTHGHPVPVPSRAGAALEPPGLVTMWLSLLLAKCEPGQKLSFCLRKANLWLISTRVSGDFFTFQGRAFPGMITDERIS